jgi:TM2 domain-containing membrane protein YozV
MFCFNCGNEVCAGNNFCPKSGQRRVGVEPQMAVVNSEDKTIIWLLFIFLGGYGAHRFYLGGKHTRWGIIYLLTFGFCGIGWWVDLFKLSKWIEEYIQTLTTNK